LNYQDRPALQNLVSIGYH